MVAPLMVFLDCEFTDFIDCDLVAIGMVSEDGQHAFYAERNDYRRDWESDFVRGGGRDEAKIRTFGP